MSASVKNNVAITFNRSTTNFFFQFNALQFFAALLVLVGHAESLRSSAERSSFHQLDFFNNGQHAVTFFFVLSGFLITFLLLKERNKTQTVQVKSLNLFICSIFFGLLIWSIVWKNKKTKFLDAQFMDYLGEISYGIYMYHLVVIIIVWAVLQPLNQEFKLETLLYHLFGIAFTIGLAAISKTYFENPILKLKNRFSV